MNYLSFRIALWKLDHREKKIKKKFYKKEDEEREKGGEEAASRFVEEPINDLGLKLTNIDEIRRYLKTQYLISKAERMCLPTPKYSENKGAWERGYYSGRFYLTEEAFANLRSLTRKERLEKHEIALRWLTISIGLIGAVTGLAAVLKAK